MTLGAFAILDTRSLDSGTVRNVPSRPPVITPSDATSLGIPKLFASSKTLKTEVVLSEPKELAFKMQQEYTPKVAKFSKPVNSLITLTLDDEGKVKYHKDMWNQKDYSHEGLGKVMKTLNGDYLIKITRPPDGL